MTKDELMTYINDLSERALSDSYFVNTILNMKKLSLRDKLIFKAGEASAAIELTGEIQEKIDSLVAGVSDD